MNIIAHNRMLRCYDEKNRERWSEVLSLQEDLRVAQKHAHACAKNGDFRGNAHYTALCTKLATAIEEAILKVELTPKEMMRLREKSFC